jgi:ferric-dicitrate binding protein FerR (iron transport regulator)
MPDFKKIEVFQKILHDAERAQMPVHQSSGYTSLSEEDKKLFEETRIIWDLSANYQASNDFNTSKAFHSFLQNIESEEKSVKNTTSKNNNIFLLIPSAIFKYAAVLLVLLAAVYFFMPKGKFYDGGSSGLYVGLEDGSKVWLQAHATLHVRKFTDIQRKLTLKGQAYFDVASRQNAPFVVKTEKMNIEVVGTRFIVNTSDAFVEVLQGSVQVIADNKKESAAENEKVQWKNNQLLKDTSAGILPDWVNPGLTFDNVPFDKVVRDMEAYFGISIELVGQSNWNTCPFTSGSLSQSPFTDILTVLKLTYEMEVEKVSDTKYRFSKIRCK